MVVDDMMNAFVFFFSPLDKNGKMSFGERFSKVSSFEKSRREKVSVDNEDFSEHSFCFENGFQCWSVDDERHLQALQIEPWFFSVSHQLCRKGYLVEVGSC